MDSPSDPHPSSRGTFLMALFGLMGGAGLLVAAMIILSPFLVQVFAAVGILILLAGVGSLHYWLWGRAFSQQVASEREEEERKSAEEADNWDIQEAPHRRWRL
jgi:hypothetical protein